jgi:hypothetical protein
MVITLERALSPSKEPDDGKKRAASDNTAKDDNAEVRHRHAINATE